MLGEADEKSKVRSLWPQIKVLTNEADHDISTQLSEWGTGLGLLNVLFIPESFNLKAGDLLSGGMNADGY